MEDKTYKDFGFKAPFRGLGGGTFRRRKYLLFLLLAFSVSFLYSQEKTSSVELTGYVSTLQSSMFNTLSGPFMNENILHNRLNFKIYPNERITFAAEFRNRLFTGDYVRLGSYYSDLIGDDTGVADISWNIVSKTSFLLNTTADRLWVDLSFGNFQVTAGRQRINWGQTLVWNPNDIFNAYSFFDFDYVERPGSDAVRLQYFTSSSSSAELAVKVDSDNDVTAAGLYRFSRWGYDIQFLAGFSNGEDVVLGTGWSGALGDYSFRGEATWFDPYEDFPGGDGSLMVTAGFDRIFRNNSMAQVQFMYCTNPPDPGSFEAFYSTNLSARDLAFSEFSAFGQFTWAVTPLINLSFSTMWFPDLEGYFAGPAFDWSMAENIDLSVLWQHFDAVMGGERMKINIGFLRLKYSF